MDRFPLIPRLGAAALLCAFSAGLLISHPRLATADAGPVPNTKVIVSTMTSTHDQPAFGTRVEVHGGRRVYVNARDGFTLVLVHGALVPARTTDGGRIWRIDGPRLYIPGAADSAVTVDNFDAQNPSTFYVYGGGEVVDITSDGGRVWRQAIFVGLEAGVSPVGDGLAAYVDQSSSTGSRGTTIQFITTNGGRSWRVATGESV